MMTRNAAGIALICLCLTQALSGQAPRGIILNPGYQYANNPITVAPSQVINLPVVGLELSSTEPPITREPMTNIWPTEAYGIQVKVRSSGSSEWQARIVHLSRQSCTQTPSGCEVSSTVTALLPPELNTLAATADNTATLIVLSNGIQIGAIPVKVVSDQLRILNSCDQTGIFISLLYDAPAGQCAYAVTHGTGYRITPESPAVPGETLVLWVFGGGAPNPGGATNALGQRADSLYYTPQISLQYGTNAAPSVAPWANGGPAVAASSVVSFAAFGQTQINFVLPPVPPGVTVASCDGQTVRSNVTVSVSGPSSKDSAGICVRP